MGERSRLEQPRQCAVGPSPPGAREAPDLSRVAIAHVKPHCGPGLSEPIVLIGAGRGERARAVLEDPRHAGSPVCVTVLDDAAFAESVAAGEWNELLTNPRLIVGRGADSAAAFRDAFGHDPAAVPDPARIAVGDVRLPAQRTRAEIEALLHHRAELLHALGARLDAWIADPAIGPSHSVFASADRSTTALRHLGREVTRAASRLGMRATFHETDLAGDPFRPVRRMQAFLDASPTMLLSFVSSRERDYGAIAAGVPAISYWSSDPERYALDSHRFHEEELVCVSDRRWMQSFARRGIAAAHMPLATGLHEELTDIEPEAPIADDRAARVLFVGNLPRAEDVLPPPLRHRAAECRERARGPEGELPLASPRGDCRPCPESDALRRAVEFERTARDRCNAVIALATAGIPLAVHGDDRWPEALRHTPAEGCWAGLLATRRENALAFRHAAAVVNVVSRNSVDAVNMRAFDVAACGGILVSSRRPGLSDAFDVGVECLDFDSTDELVGAVRAILDSPDRGASLRRRGTARALRDHTWESRWRSMLSLLRQRQTVAA